MEQKTRLYRDLFFRHLAQTSSAPLGLPVERADGVFLYSGDRRIFDLVSGVSVSNVGHAHPEVVAAVREQAANYFHLMVYGELIQAPQVLYARLLAEQLPAGLDSVYFVNSGSEANEVALKLAKRLTGRDRIVSCRNAYHGCTHATMSLMSDPAFRTAFSPLVPGTEQIRFNDFADLDRIDRRTAAVILEPVQGEGGVIVPVPGYLEAVRRRCDETGALLIFDEVQTGFGRTGTLFAFQRSGVVPDILTLAKALGGGMPLGAAVSSSERMKAWQSAPMLGHITTFGGHPVSCAAGLAALRILLRESWIAEADRKSDLIVSLLADHPLVREIRRAGLLLAVDLGRADYAAAIIPLLLEEGVMSDYFLYHPTSFRIAPPLCITDAEIRDAMAVVRRALDRIARID